MNRTTLIACLGLAALSVAATASSATYQIVELGKLGGATSSALDVNNKRQATGNSLVASDPGASGSLLRAYDWSLATGAMTNLGELPGVTANRFARGYVINGAGDIVDFGTFEGSSRAFLLTAAPESGTLAHAGIGRSGSLGASRARCRGGVR
jgi:hypothetical protein